MLFGWERVPSVIHFISTILVAFGANLSTFWILSANSWIQTSASGEFVNGKFVVQDYFQAIANPFMVNSFLHMFFATLETSLFMIGGISAWYILNQRHTAFFSKSLKVVLTVAIAIAPLQIFVGHLSAEQVYHYQPTKRRHSGRQLPLANGQIGVCWQCLTTRQSAMSGKLKFLVR